jgi:hypothetical protein
MAKRIDVLMPTTLQLSVGPHIGQVAYVGAHVSRREA